ncbi:MAG: YcjX family protein, partial [Rhodobiaceae bacterium]|nr:YcjX family protein [Rhodobiaceae bacterium]
EWLLDLPLLAKSYETWSRETLATSEMPTRAPLAAEWRAFLAEHGPETPADEALAAKGAAVFTGYLRQCRDERVSLSTLPPGRFLMPGDMEGSPALTFLPLDVPAEGSAPAGSLWAMMRERYEAYKTHVVKPFFRDHFARLDRQIVLVDALSALNAGPNAVQDLERALTDILACFRPGSKSWLSGILTRRIDRILFAASKADHLHHTAHDRLERILLRLVRNARERASFSGATIDVMALAAIRATREDTLRRDGTDLEVVIGTPAAGERIGGTVFDGSREFAFFPGDLPESPEALFKDGAYRGLESHGEGTDTDLRFTRFRPPDLARLATRDGRPVLPHIRLDSALQFLIGDRLA